MFVGYNWYHVETNKLVFKAELMTGFYVTRTLALKFDKLLSPVSIPACKIRFRTAFGKLRIEITNLLENCESFFFDA